jgi:putative spermidine/putrescine transport system permease protein
MPSARISRMLPAAGAADTAMIDATGKRPAPRRRGGARPGMAAWLAAPALLMFVLFFVLPFGVMAVMSFLSGSPLDAAPIAPTPRHYLRFFNDELYTDALLATLRIGLLTALAALVLGYPLAHWMARMRSRLGHALLLMAVIAPMLTGIVVRTFAWMTLLQDKGVINTLLIGAGWTRAPLQLMYNELGTVIAMVHIYVPFMVLTLIGVIGRIDVRLEQAARNLGASAMRAFLEVTLPLSMPGIIGGSLLVFALAISAYITPFMMGGNAVLTLPMLIYQQVGASFNLNFAGALGVVLLAVSLLVVLAYHRVLAFLSGDGGL